MYFWALLLLLYFIPTFRLNYFFYLGHDLQLVQLNIKYNDYYVMQANLFLHKNNAPKGACNFIFQWYNMIGNYLLYLHKPPDKN